MNTNTVGRTLDADLLQLARSVEHSVPADLDQARACLQQLNDALSHQQPGELDSSIPSSQPNDDESRLRSLIARITDDLAGGRVLGVTGLEREIKRYLTRTRA